MRRSFSPAVLARLRDLASELVLSQVAIDLKVDPTFTPTKRPDSRRWHAHTTQGDFEILTTGAKWYDTRVHKGGGGAIDLTMHVLGLSFVGAVKYLTACLNLYGSDHS